MHTRKFVSLAFAAALVAGGTGAAEAANAASSTPAAAITHSTVTVAHVAAKPKPKKYKNCKALNKVYKHGVGKKGAKDKVRGTTKPVKNFTRDNKTYKLNKARDRDKDGIACEKR